MSGPVRFIQAQIFAPLIPDGLEIKLQTFGGFQRLDCVSRDGLSFHTMHLPI